MEARHYDAIVIGSGQAGGPLASALARSGRKTALIERAHHGGTCVNTGCTPTKTMVASARVAELASRGDTYGVTGAWPSINMEKVRARKRAMVNTFREGSRRSLEETDGLDLYRAEARFTGQKTLSLTAADATECIVTAEMIFVNTGGRPSVPEISGLSDVPYLDSTSIMELGRVPDHLVVIGGGYIGLEFAQMFGRFAADITIVNRSKQIASREDDDIAECLATILIDEGNVIVNEAGVTKVEKGGQGILVTLSTPAGEQTLDASHILIATGRTPNTDALDPAAAGIKMDDRGYIPTDDQLRTNVPGIYALGDVRGGPAFTHISYDDFRVIRTNVIGGGNTSISSRMVPYTVFTDPQLGRIGLTETEARERGLAFRVAKIPMTAVARALETDESRGLMKALVDKESGQILGAAVLGLEGGEIMAMLQIAMMGKLPYSALRDGIFAHPTLAESLNTLFSSFTDGD
ncbi:MAG: mercuric reductase [Thermomicrobiales bacterium]